MKFNLELFKNGAVAITKGGEARWFVGMNPKSDHYRIIAVDVCGRPSRFTEKGIAGDELPSEDLHKIQAT